MPRLAVLLLSLCVAGAAAGRTAEEDVQYYLEVFKGGELRIQAMACEDLGWKGISDPRLFDFLEQRILAEQDAARSSTPEKDRIARYFRALGFSGQAKYLPTISRFKHDRTYYRYAEQALTDQPAYARWNPEISARASWDPKLGDDANRVMNMLRSNDLLLLRVGAKRVYFAVNDDAVLELLAARLKEFYPRSWDGDQGDAVAWMAKALGHTAREKYRPLLEEVQSSPTRGVRNQAASALRQSR